MNSLIPDGEDPPSRVEARLLESRTDARFQAINARFTTMDRRFTSLMNRLGELETHLRSLGEQMDAEERTTEGRFDAVDARIDLVHDNVVTHLDRSRSEHLRLLALGMAGTTALGDC